MNNRVHWCRERVFFWYRSRWYVCCSDGVRSGRPTMLPIRLSWNNVSNRVPAVLHRGLGGLEYANHLIKFRFPVFWKREFGNCNIPAPQWKGHRSVSEGLVIVPIYAFMPSGVTHKVSLSWPSFPQGTVRTPASLPNPKSTMAPTTDFTPAFTRYSVQQCCQESI